MVFELQRGHYCFLLYWKNRERVYPYSIPITTVTGNENFQQLQEKLKIEFPQLIPEGHLLFSPMEKSRKVKSFGTETLASYFKANKWNKAHTRIGYVVRETPDSSQQVYCFVALFVYTYNN